MLYQIVAGGLVLFVAVGGLLILVRARRAGLAVHRQLDLLRAKTDMARTDSAAAALRTDTELANLRSEVHAVAAQVQTFGMQSVQMLDTLRDETSRLNHTVRDAYGQLTRLTSIVEETAHEFMRRPFHALPIDSRWIESAREEEIIAAAESVAILRPLIPYPRWTTDADAHNPDLSFRLRLWFWEYFTERRREAPVVVRWHDNTRLRLLMGNDISRQIYSAGCFEPNEFAFLDRVLRPGMVFLDAGANEGCYTVFAAKRVGPAGLVLAFEPSSRELERLQFNLNLNGLSAQLHSVALADFNGQAEFMISEFQHSGQNTLGDFAYEGMVAERRESVDVRRLDDVLEKNAPARIDVMKIDVEGSELRLLRGAVGIVERYRPYILFEVSDNALRSQGGSREELGECLRSQKYRLYAFDRLTGLPTPAADGIYTDNMIAAPHESPLPGTVQLPWPAIL